MDSSSSQNQRLEPGVHHYFQTLASEVVPTVREAVQRKVDDDATVKIIVAGASKAGKSLLIRKFLNYPTGDPKAPKFGQRNEHRTTTLLSFQRDEMPGIIMYDAMGIGHGDMKVSPENYCKKLNFDSYDIVILLTAGQFAVEELSLWNHVNKLKTKPACFLVMSHFDEHIKDEAENGVTNVEEAAQIVRRDMEATIIQKVGQNVKLFCLDSRKPDQFDFPNLMEAISAALTNEKQSLAMKRLFLLSDESVKQKATAWRKDLPLISIPSGTAGLSPIPGTDIVAELGYISGFAIKFYRDFCLSEAKLQELCDTYGLANSVIAEIRAKFKFAKIDAENVKNSLANGANLAMLLRNFVKLGVPLAIASSDDVIKTVPVVGALIGCALGAVTGYFTTWYLLKRILDGCEHDGLIVVQEIRCHLANVNNPQSKNKVA